MAGPDAPLFGKKLERVVATTTAEKKVVAMATAFFGGPYLIGKKGLDQAKADITTHRATIFPKIAPAELSAMIEARDPFIHDTQQEALASLQQGQYVHVLEAMNRLHVYGEESRRNWRDQGVAFIAAFLTQKTVTNNLIDNFLDTDPYLSVHKEELQRLRQPRTGLPMGEEYDLLRSVAHTVAYNGTLGEKARRRFDPYAFDFVRTVFDEE